MESYSMYSLVSGLFCSILYLWDSFILLNTVVDGSFSLLYNIPLCDYVTVLFILLFINVSVVSNFLAITWCYEYYCMCILLNTLYEFTLRMYLRIEFLGNEHIHVCSPITDTANIFQSGSHQQRMRVLIAPDFCQHLVFTMFINVI